MRNLDRNRAGSGRARVRSGQVIVEVLLILPVFLLLVFGIMELGHLAFRTILIHHAAYEVARIGSLTATPDEAPSACTPPQVDQAHMEAVSRRILPTSRLEVEPHETLTDPQEGCKNYDVEVRIRQKVPLIFPLTSLVLGTPRGNPYREVSGRVRMPIERPLFQSRTSR